MYAQAHAHTHTQEKHQYCRQQSSKQNKSQFPMVQGTAEAVRTRVHTLPNIYKANQKATKHGIKQNYTPKRTSAAHDPSKPPEERPKTDGPI